MKKYAIIVAGGSGTRFGSDVPKQFLPLAGIPVLMHTVRKFAHCNAQVVLVLPSAQQDYWRELCKNHHFEVECTVATGGSSRFESVKNGLRAVEALAAETCDVGEKMVVAVHDGVRPLVSPKVIERAYEEAAIYGSAVPVVAVTDSIRHIEPDGTSRAMRRDELVAVQTPQTFTLDLLHEAYNVELSPLFTDDASVVEAAGHCIHLIEGNHDNMKITHPGDIAIAENILKNATTC
ncbi:MAG: 2-C-methyl-D-erythritol 4-phosphate cytidylyltransferase [Muribaculaceae bacterium]